MLIYTKNTIGENSPLKVKRTYQITVWQYFSRFNPLAAYYFVTMGFVILKMIFVTEIPLPENYRLLIYLILICTGLLFFFSGIYSLIIQVNHWKYTNGVVLITNPKAGELHLKFSHTDLTLQEGDLKKIVTVSNLSQKMRFCYVTYYLKNGDHFILSENMPGIWVIREYFKKVPVEYVYHRFPYISSTA